MNGQIDRNPHGRTGDLHSTVEKIFLKPTFQEILLKSSSPDEHTDIFSYEAENDELARKLGSIFIIGHVQHTTDDLAYAINLIAALTKREYYNSAEVTAKEAFATTLKKINEVVEEFFEKKGIALNIGIFAIANEQLLISKLGKFKIILGRDNKNIDVFNNIQFFSKEPSQEIQFSSIISGQIKDTDRIFAFYPAKTVVTREKKLKSDFLKLNRDDFIDKLKSLKNGKGKNNFACTALYIDLNNVKEIAAAPQIQPQELKKASLASTKKSRRSVGDVASALEQEQTAVKSSQTNAHSKLARIPTPEAREEFQETPRIIPTEFSMGRKNTLFSKIKGNIRLSNFTPRKTAVISLVVIALVVSGVWTVRNIFSRNPQVQQADAAVEEATNALKLARTKVTQNDITGARALLLSSISSLANKTQSGKATEIQNQLLQALDELDQAKDAQLSLILDVPSDMGQATLLTARASGLAFFSSTADKEFVVRISSSSIESAAEIKNMKPSRLLTGKQALLLIDAEQGKIARIRAEEVKTAALDFTQILHSALYEDNLYTLTANDIQKIIDATKDNTKVTAWLKDTALPSDSLFIAVDGNVYVLGKSGYITTYFRGDKTAEFSTSLSPAPDNIFLTTADGESLYLADKVTGRIYLINKKSGNITRTLKVGNNKTIIDVAVAPNGTIYILTKDNKIWRVSQ